jgi:eukaryotic-like serine/threonine-protein kinase
MDYTVENLRGFLIRSKLFAPDNIAAIHQRWQAEAGPNAAQATAFLRWLVSRQYLTEYQANLLGKGQVDHFFLNDYKVLERVGRGRMAGVYKATHRLGQVVAIKVLPPSRAKNAQLLARFQREARLSLRLRHPNIVRSFQVGQAHNLHYLVMELLEGDTLDEALHRRRRLPPEEAVRLVHQALLGLQNLHEQAMVHRDLKPSNLMLVPAPGRDKDETTTHATVKILDIGLAREMYDEESPPEKADQLTADGVLLGTPDYMAPEQARDPRSSDIRADIYSLGCVLYHLLTGQVPFPEKNLLRQLVRHANEAARDMREFNPQVPEGLEQIVRWMMAKKPEERYPTPLRAAQALEVFMMAGNNAAPAEEAPQMQSYLTWLDTENDATAPASLASAETCTPAQTASIPVGPALDTTTLLPRPGRASEKKTTPPPSKTVVEAPPETSLPDTKTAPVESETSEDEADLWERVKQLSRREWALLGIGAGISLGMCVFGELVLLFFRWVSTPRPPDL